MNKEMCIILVRHGETDWNRKSRFQGRMDVPLNSKGKKEAHSLARALRNETILAFYSSPLSRAEETAQTIKKFHPAASYFVDDGLLEMDLGEFDGMEASIWVKKYPDLLKPWQDTPSTFVMPGGECLPDVQSRAIKTINRIIGENPSGSTIIVCSHNFIIVSIICHALNIHLDQFREVRQGTGSYSRLNISGNHWEWTGAEIR